MVKEHSDKPDLPRGFVAQDRRDFLNMVVRGLGLAVVGAPCAMGQSLLLRPAPHANAPFAVETRSVSYSYTETWSYSSPSHTYTFTKEPPDGGPGQGTYSFTYSYPAHTTEHRGWWVTTWPPAQTITVYDTATVSYAQSWSYSHSISYVGSGHTATVPSFTHSRLETHYQTATYTVETHDDDEMAGGLRGEHDGCVDGALESLDPTIDLTDRRSRRGRALHPILRRLA